MMNWKKEFEEWFDEYFSYTQGEDSHSYIDVKTAFKAGYREGYLEGRRNK